jgi:DNA-damage-inducible protein J
MNTTLQTRINAKLKAEAKKTLESAGLDLSTGIKLFLTQVVRTQSIPFEILSANNLSESVKKSIVKETKQALKSKTRYSSAKSAHDNILQ